MPRTILAPHGTPQPFYSSPSGPPQPRRLLLLTYHFPPSRETGALRWESMLRYAENWGWQADVITLHPRHLSTSSPERLEGLPLGCRVYGVPQEALAIERVEKIVLSLLRTLRSIRKTFIS